MNKQKWLFIGTDRRLLLCSEQMRDAGYDCRIVQTDTYSAELEQMLIDFKPAHIVFPILEMTGTIPVELLAENTSLYTGVASDAWVKPFVEAGFTVNSYIKEEIFIWENARLTAEAFIHAFHLKTGRSISQQHFAVAGYGRVGKMVATTLRSLGGHVTVLARSDVQIGEAAAQGFKTSRLRDFIKHDDCFLINTIPAKWYGSQKQASLFIFDLASAPGCLTDAGVPEYYTILPGLPGKHFPIDAAIALQGALERIYRR